MRSITTKLTLAFLLVGITGAILVAVIVRWRTVRAFDQFMINREQQALINSLLQYYQANEGWQGIDTQLQALQSLQPPPVDGNKDFRDDWQRFVLIGPDRVVIFSHIPDQIGQTVSSRELKDAIELEIDGEQAGWLLLDSNPRQWMPDTPEGLFLRTVTSATLVSALVAGGLALILGGLLAFTMTRSLREMKEATVEIARGKLGLQVKVRSKDELGELADSFNQMSLGLERATIARRQMTADIAHDLRSPLSVISGYAEALSDGKLPGTPEVYEILNQETKHLNHLVEDLRLLSLADAGELSLTRQLIAPQVILERVAARHMVSAQQKGITLRVESPGSLALIDVDVERMIQVFDNLVMNAFRYTPEGGEIVMTARDAEKRVQLEIRDNGSGISAEDLPHIFDRFYRGDKSRQENGESGLGLAIAKSIIEAQGGTISVESAPGLGTTFTVSCTAAQTA
jgi:signal transduction histidine kinase